MAGGITKAEPGNYEDALVRLNALSPVYLNLIARIGPCLVDLPREDSLELMEFILSLGDKRMDEEGISEEGDMIRTKCPMAE